jgi:putative restriction endonuclease
MTIGARRVRFTVEQYDRMGETGILPDDPRVELLCGHIIAREPTGSRHAGTVARLTMLWTWRLGERVIVNVQNPVQFPKEDSELQPDIMLLKPRADFYTGSHPLADDVLLLIEVADTSLRLDRRVKIPLYARAGIRETWLCDLVTGRVKTHRDPMDGRYRSVQTRARGETLAPTALPDIHVGVEDLIG